MYRLTRNLYILAFITIIILVSGWYYQHYSANHNIQQNTRQTAEITVQSLSSAIGNKLASKGSTIEAAATLIALQKWDNNDLLAYLEALLEDNDIFVSIYYGSPDNEMINASGWEPPDGFDLRERPWYTKALAEEKVIFTEAFINASSDLIIVTVACPVFDNRNGDLLGVVGGDLSVGQIVELVQTKSSEEVGYSFLVDSNGNVLAHPELEYDPDLGFVTLEEINGKLAELHDNNEALNSPVILDESKGYLAYLPLEHSDWHLATFIPFEGIMANPEQMSAEYLIAGTVILMVFLLFVIYQHIFVYRPLLALENNIKQIDVEKKSDYRVPVNKCGEFAILGNTVNRLLDQVHSYLNKLEENEESLKAANSELETILRQLTTAEEALDYSEEKLYYLSYHDQLTGLYNRFFFEARLRQLSEKPEYPTTIITTDIDGLKLINDTIGQSAGNRLLKICATIVSETLDGEGILARVGGDEFSAILPLASKEEGEKIARQIRYQVNHYNQANTNLPLSLSIGIATAEDSSISLKKLLKLADDQLIRNKLHRHGSASNNVVSSLVTAMGERDNYSGGHAKRLEKMCLYIGEKMGLSSQQLGDLALLAQVHDLGKVAIPDAILFKPGPLTEEEWQGMKRHSEKGYRISSSSTELAAVANLILRHHEHWDGSGYPLGLRGNDIPIECRILAIADAFDVMTNERPYREPVSVKEALEEIRACSGSQFDPAITKVFISLVESGRFNKI